MSPAQPDKPHTHAFGLSLLVSALFIVAIVSLVPFRFETNDDVVMLLIASGAYTGTPDQHLVFMHVGLGFVLKFFYQNFAGVAFYTGLMLAAHVYASAVLLAFLWRLQLRKAAFTCLALLLLMFEFAAIIRLQFTITSGLLATAAVVQLMQPTPWPRWLGLSTFVMAVCFRFEAAMMVLVLAAPLLLDRQHPAQGIKLLILLACSATLVKAIDEVYYHTDPAWQSYKTYDKARGKINDNPNEQGFTSDSSAEQNDYRLLLRFVPNPAAISTARLHEIADALNNRAMAEKIQNVKNTWMLLGMPMALLLGIFTLLLVGLPKQDRWLAAAAIAIYALLSVYISLNSTFKPRVFSTSAAPLLFAYLPCLLKKITRSRLSIALHIGTWAFSAGLAHASQNELSSHPLRLKLISEQMQLIEKYQEHHAKPIYTVVLKTEYLNPFNVTTQMAGKPIVYGGWLTKAPFTQQLKSFEELLNHAMLVSQADLQTTVPMVLASMKNNHAIDAAFHVMEASDGFAIVEFRRQTSRQP
jgi:hypothetical protein